MDMDNLADALGQFVQGAISAGFQFPFYMSAVAVNGSVIVSRWTQSNNGEIEMHFIAEHIEGEMMALPINVMLIDSTGQAARMLIEGPEPEFFWPDSLPSD